MLVFFKGMFGLTIIAIVGIFMWIYLEQLNNFVENIHTFAKLVPILAGLWFVWKLWFGNNGLTKDAKISTIIGQIANATGVYVPSVVGADIGQKQSEWVAASGGWRCSKCDKRLVAGNYQICPIIPTAKLVLNSTKRANDISNMQAVCNKCL